MRASEPVGGHRLGLWLGTLLVPIAFFGACGGLARLAGASRFSDDPKLSLIGRVRFFEPVDPEEARRTEAELERFYRDRVPFLESAASTP